MTERIRIVRKKRRNKTEHHGGAWKVAYADFVTAMMAFFLVMWMVGLNTAVRESIASYFKDPIGFMKGYQTGGKPLNLETPGVLTEPDVTPDFRKDSYELNKKLQEKQRFKDAKEILDKLISNSPEFHDLGKSVSVRISDEGLRIDLMELRSETFFDSGSATMKPRTRALLARVSTEVGKLPNEVVVEGHTDSRPYMSRNGWTNWELSTARANAARSVMETSGLKRNQIAEVRGLADKMPIDPAHPESFRNRRVSILLPSMVHEESAMTPSEFNEKFRMNKPLLSDSP